MSPSARQTDHEQVVRFVWRESDKQWNAISNPMCISIKSHQSASLLRPWQPTRAMLDVLQ
eukprot:8834533-Karenia_brevis.AAC.1